MLAATSKVCPKGLVAFETLEAVHAQLVGLPIKEKRFFKTKEAVAYLFQDIHDAIVNKNYTIEDISQSFVAAGWSISQTSLKRFWRFFRAYLESHTDSKTSTTKEEQNEHIKTPRKKRKILSSVIDGTVIKDISENNENDTQNLSSVHQDNASGTSEILPSEHEKITSLPSDENIKKEDFQPQNSAHFDLPPDTEDL